MTANTPQFRLPYPVDSDNISDIPDILRAQAESIEKVLKEFDFNGQDPNALVSKVSSHELRIVNLERTTEYPIFYQRNTRMPLQKAVFQTIPGLSPVLQNTEYVTYANGAFKFNYDCIATVCCNVTIDSNSSTDYSQRNFIALGLNWSGIDSPLFSSRLGLANFGTEFSASSFYAGKMNSGDTLTPFNYNTREVQPILQLATMSIVVKAL
ncbi:MAG: hypothetical protein ACTILK_00650 [Bifidobacterium crudilactis]|uniref:hypothetical protein n=1 Tax=Bifidobacterium crudilactis TaxID=327277 RepID=UPI003F96DC7B